MTKKQESATKEFFVIGRDLDEKPRGARFDTYHEPVFNLALDLGLSGVITASPEFAAAAKKLPAGRLYTSGKAFIPNIKEALLAELVAILRVPGDTSQAYRLENRPKKPGQAQDGSPSVRCKSPITSGLPKYWEDVEVGHLVLAQESPADGWWEAVVIDRSPEDILTLRYRDAPKLPTFVRHLTTVALINPGPLANES